MYWHQNNKAKAYIGATFFFGKRTYMQTLNARLICFYPLDQFRVKFFFPISSLHIFIYKKMANSLYIQISLPKKCQFSCKSSYGKTKTETGVLHKPLHGAWIKLFKLTTKNRLHIPWLLELDPQHWPHRQALMMISLLCSRWFLHWKPKKLTLFPFLGLSI